jgi:glycosyltransferase involved in cell wall biosynthesis
MSPTLSVVMPVYNEAAHLPATIAALVEAVRRSEFDAELVVSDDGSTDGSADVVHEALAARLPLRLVSRSNSGRFEARRAGLEAATGKWILLLDARVRLAPDALAYVQTRLPAGERVWNGHVHVETDGNPYGAFWNVIVKLAWREYFDDPRPTSFDESNFDRYPKGTTCFLAPRELLLEAVDEFRTRYGDIRHANDDTPLIRSIAARDRVHLSPSFDCEYSPRATLQSFVRHSFHRGIVFLDGHGRRESRLFPLVVAFYPVSAGLALASIRRPALIPILAVAGACSAGALAAAARRPPFEALSFGALLPLYAVLHGAGMWRGLAMMAHAGVRPAPSL